ncbi:MAG: hypothetical protein FD149_2718 [Rhodospirillaceae bacterium]|nr:MAG: hypothetical protein FD149_2718 [Rhodospirillaceae bacterium]
MDTIDYAAAQRELDGLPEWEPPATDEAPPDEAPLEYRTSAPVEKISQRNKLITACSFAMFWQDWGDSACATVLVKDHHEHHPVRSQFFRNWLLMTAGRLFPDIINGQSRPGSFGKTAVEDALCRCEAEAAYSEKKHDAPLRVVEHDGHVYLDLGTDDWRVVKISLSGWRIQPAAPVPIMRARRAHPLPTPVVRGAVSELRPFLNVADESGFRLVVLWLLAALSGRGPYPILALSGEQGTGKSTFSRMLRRLVDPVGAGILQPPKDERDLIAVARGNHVLAFDNVSSLSADLADSLCRLSTGGDLGGRRLYTNDELATFSAYRPIILNGIPDLATRGDLASRALFIRLQPIERRQTEADLWRDFNAVAGRILGGLLTVLAEILTMRDKTRLPADAADIRMADLAVMALSAERPLGWPAGSALEALRGNVDKAVALLIEMDPVAAIIQGLLARYGSFDGLATDIYERCLSGIGDDAGHPSV